MLHTALQPEKCNFMKFCIIKRSYPQIHIKHAHPLLILTHTPFQESDYRGNVTNTYEGKNIIADKIDKKCMTTTREYTTYTICGNEIHCCRNVSLVFSMYKWWQYTVRLPYHNNQMYYALLWKDFLLQQILILMKTFFFFRLPSKGYYQCLLFYTFF